MKFVVVLVAFSVFALTIEISLAHPVYSNVDYEQVDTQNLDQLFVILRHGARAPWSTYPNDPNKDNLSRWPLGRSQLTQLGVEQASNIGKLVATRYKPFVEKLRTRQQILLRSSAAQRCLDTIQLAMRNIWLVTSSNNEIDQMKMPPVYSLPKKVDSVLYEEPECHSAEEEEKNNLKSSAALEFLDQSDIKDLMSYVSNVTGLDGTWSGMSKAFDCVRCEKINGFDIAPWAKINRTYEKLDEFYTRYLNFLYQSFQSQRMRAGPILQDVVDKISEFDATKFETRRVLIYATHDFKIAALVKALGNTLRKYPSFASTILVEVHSIPGSSEKTIRVFHVDQTTILPYAVEELRLNYCLHANETQCTLSNWKESLKPFVNVQWEKECELSCGRFDFSSVAEDSLGDS